MKKFFPFFLFFCLSFLLVFLLYWRFRVSTTRFFDVDEFAYLHWTAQVARGEEMYVDFYTYFTPGFMWVFAPIFWMYGASVRVFTAARGLSFVIFLGILGSVGYLFGITRGWKWALLPAVILAFLPMPYDKLLEIRPDNLATLLALIGVIGEIRGIRENKNIWWILSGLAFSASLFVLTKMVPIVAVGAGIAVLYAIFSKSRTLFMFFFGLLGPWILFFLGAAITGRLDVVWYSLTKLPFESYRDALNYFMAPDLFFHPNASFYGGNNSTITPGLIVNHTIWIVAVSIGTYRLVTPIRGGSYKNDTFTELLIAGVCMVSVLAYVKYFPLKHSQYLIPIAVYIAYYAADGLSIFFDWLEHAGGRISLWITLTGFMALLVSITTQVNAPKLLTTNVTQLAEIQAMLRMIPLSARVVDLEGRMVFWQEGYPVCCYPLDTFVGLISRPPESLARYLTRHSIDYMYNGDNDRMDGLSAESMTYIRAHFAPVGGFGNRLWKRL